MIVASEVMVSVVTVNVDTGMMIDAEEEMSVLINCCCCSFSSVAVDCADVCVCVCTMTIAVLIVVVGVKRVAAAIGWWCCSTPCGKMLIVPTEGI